MDETRKRKPQRVGDKFYYRTLNGEQVLHRPSGSVKAKIVAAYRPGLTVVEIAEATDETTWQVARALQDAGLPVKRGSHGGSRKRKPHPKTEKIIADYVALVRMEDILKRHGVASCTVYNILKRRKIPHRGTVRNG